MMIPFGLMLLHAKEPESPCSMICHPSTSPEGKLSQKTYSMTLLLMVQPQPQMALHSVPSKTTAQETTMKKTPSTKLQLSTKITWL